MGGKQQELLLKVQKGNEIVPGGHLDTEIINQGENLQRAEDKGQGVETVRIRVVDTGVGIVKEETEGIEGVMSQKGLEAGKEQGDWILIGERGLYLCQINLIRKIIKNV